VFSGDRIRIAEEASIPIPAGGHSKTGGPSIHVVRAGNDVEAIDIACRCGCQIRVVCEYDSPAPS
jgi:hypothetical protein